MSFIPKAYHNKVSGKDFCAKLKITYILVKLQRLLRVLDAIHGVVILRTRLASRISRQAIIWSVPCKSIRLLCDFQSPHWHRYIKQIQRLCCISIEKLTVVHVL